MYTTSNAVPLRSLRYGATYVGRRKPATMIGDPKVLFRKGSR